jgi:hypothetical protein
MSGVQFHETRMFYGDKLAIEFCRESCHIAHSISTSAIQSVQCSPEMDNDSVAIAV